MIQSPFVTFGNDITERIKNKGLLNVTTAFFKIMVRGDYFSAGAAYFFIF